MITTDLAQECFVETNCHLRTPEQHEKQCEYLNGPLHHHFSVNFGINSAQFWKMYQDSR